MLAVVVVLVPGLLLYSLLRALGLEIGPAGVLGLLLMIVGMGVYPVILRRTGWVGPSQRPAPRNKSATQGRPDETELR